LSDGIDLGCVTTTGDSDADIDVGELVKTNNEEGFVDLESQDLWLDEVEGLSVNLDESLSGLHSKIQLATRLPNYSSSILPEPNVRPVEDIFIATSNFESDSFRTYPAVGDSSCCLLLSETLDGLCGGHLEC
jgi:hypothetical protein